MSKEIKIIDKDNFKLWWKLASSWFDTRFSSIKNKIDNIAIPTDYAKQGENAEATNSAILESVGEVNTHMREGIKDIWDEYSDEVADKINAISGLNN